MAKSTTNVRLEVSANDRASPQLQRISREIDRLSDEVSGFDASSGKAIDRSFERITRNAAAGTRAIKQQMAQMSEVIDAGKKTLSSMQTDLADANSKLLTNRSSVDALKRQRADMTREMDASAAEIEAQIAKRNRQLKSLGGQRLGVDNKLKDDGADVPALEAKKLQIRKDAEKLRNEISALQQSAVAGRVKVDTSVIDDEISKRGAEIRALEAQVKRLEKAVPRKVQDVARQETRLSQAGVLAGEFGEKSGKVDDIRSAYGKGGDLRAAAAAADMDKLASANGNVERSFRRQALSASDSARAFSAMRGQVAGLISAYVILAGVVGEAAKSVETFRSVQAFNTKMNFVNDGDIRRTGEDLEYAREMANRFGFEVLTIQGQMSSFAIATDAAGISTSDFKTAFEGLLTISRGTNLTNEQFGRSVVAVTQMLSKGKVSSEELRQQLGDAMPQAVSLFAESMGYAADQMGKFWKDLEAGKFDGDSVIKFLSFAGVKYASAADEAAKSFEAILARFRNTLTAARESFAKAGLIDGLTAFMDRSTKFFESDEGKTFFIQLGAAAKNVLELTAYLVENLETIAKVLAGIVIFKGGAMIGGAFAGIATSLVLAGRAMKGFSFAGIAAGAAAAAGTMSKLGRVGAILSKVFLGLRVLSGPVGLGLTALALVMPKVFGFFDDEKAQEQIDANERLSNVASTIGSIRAAAMEARGDLQEFQRLIKDIGSPEEIEKAQFDAMAESYRLYKELDGSTRSIELAAVVDGKGEEAIKPIKDAISGLLDGSLKYDAPRVGESAANSFLKVLEDLREKELISEEYLQFLKDKGKAYELNALSLADLNKVLEAVNGNEDAAKKLQGDFSEDVSLENTKRLTALNAAIDNLKSKIEDDGGKSALAKRFEDIEKAAEDARKKLDEMGKALSPEEHTRHLAEIGRAYRQLSSEINASIIQTDAAARGFNVQIGAMSQSVVSQNNTVTPGTPYAGAKGSNDFLDFIAQSEGTEGHARARGYNTTLDYGRWTGGERDLTSMTLAQIRDLQRSMLSHQGNLDKYGDGKNRGSSALGRYQIVGKTLQSLMDKLNLDPNEKFDASMQDRLAMELANGRMSRGGNVGDEWEGVKKRGVEQQARSLYASIGRGRQASDEQISAVQGVQSSASGLNKEAMDAIAKVALSNPSLNENRDFHLALSERRFEDAAKFLDAFDKEAADKFREQTRGNIVEQDASKLTDVAKRHVDAQNEIIGNAGQAALQAIADEDERWLAEQRREIEDEARTSGVALDPDAAQRLLDSRVALRRANQTREAGQTISERQSEQTYEASTIGLSDRAKEELRLRREIDEVARRTGNVLTEAQKAQYVTNGLLIHDSKARAESRETVDGQLRSERAGIEVAKERSAIERIRMETLNEIAEAERNGAIYSQSDKDQMVAARIDRYKAETPGWQMAETDATIDTAPLEAQLASLRANLEATDDIGLQDEIRKEIRATTEELMKLYEAKKLAYGVDTGPEAVAAIAAIQSQQNEISKSTEGVSNYGKAAAHWSVKVGETLSQASASFAQAVKEGENPWRALANSVRQSVGQILIDIGSMIIKAAVAQQVMKALNLDQNGMPQAGSGGGGGGIFGTILTAGFNAITGTGGFKLPVFHDGGRPEDGSKRNMSLYDAVFGLKHDEVPAILQTGERVLSRKETKQVDSLLGGISSIQRYHSGGRIGSLPSSTPSVSSISGGVAKMASEISEANAGKEMKSGDVLNFVDSESFMNAALSGRHGAQMILNVLSADPQKAKAALGIA